MLGLNYAVVAGSGSSHCCVDVRCIFQQLQGSVLAGPLADLLPFGQASSCHLWLWYRQQQWSQLRDNGAAIAVAIRLKYGSTDALKARHFDAHEHRFGTDVWMYLH